MSDIRVAYLAAIFPRATDTWIQRELASLRKADVEVETFAIRRPDADHIVGPEQRAEQDRVTYILEAAKSPKLLVSHAKLLVRSPKRYVEGAKLAWSTKRAGIKGSLYQLFYFAEAGLLAEELKIRKVQHLHNHFGDSGCTVSMLASTLSGIPYSFTLHGPGIFFEANTWRLDAKIKRAAFVASISYFCRSQAAIFAEPEDVNKLHIIHCGVNTEALTPVQHDGVGTEVIFVARLAELKGVSDLLRAVEKLVSEHGQIHLTVVGDGPERNRFEKLSKKLKLDHNVTFTGYLSQAEVADYLKRSHVLVLPSYAEGVPVSLMEALASQVPVIATQVGGVSELVEDGVNGFIVRPGDVDQLADRLGALLSDGALRQSMGEAGRATTVSDFNNDLESRRLKALFSNSIKGLPTPMRPELRAETQT